MNSVTSAFNPMAQYSVTTGSDAFSFHPGQSLESAAKGMEGTFLTLLLKEMRQGLEPGGLFGQDSGDVLGGMFDQFMAQHLTQAGGLGIARVLQQQLEPRLTNEQSHATANRSG
jgi:Rod binding domain-containing protein